MLKNKIFALLIILAFFFSGCGGKITSSEVIVLTDSTGASLFSPTGEFVKQINKGDGFRFSYWPDSGNIYLGEITSSNNLKVYNYNFEENQSKLITELINPDSRPGYWGDGTFELFQKKGNKLKVLCDIREIIPFSSWAGKAYVIDLSTGNTEFFKLDTQDESSLPQIDDSFWAEEWIETIENKKNMEKFRIGDSDALLFLLKNKQTEIHRPGSNEEVFGYFVNLTPNLDKILFAVVNSFGDYSHGPVYIINADGRDKLKLADDFFLTELFYSKIRKNTYAFIRLENKVKIINEKNQTEVTLNNVRSFNLPPQTNIDIILQYFGNPVHIIDLEPSID